MPDPSDMEALALAAESFGRLAEAINTVTEKMADAIARNATDIRELRDENRALSNRIEAVARREATIHPPDDATVPPDPLGGGNPYRDKDEQHP